jgi:hypothetical protein
MSRTTGVALSFVLRFAHASTIAWITPFCSQFIKGKISDAIKGMTVIARAIICIAADVCSSCISDRVQLFIYLR